MKIDKNIPMPLRSGKYGFDKMEVGDSIFFDGVKHQGKEYAYAQQLGTRMGRKFSGRSMDGGLRIWRVE